MSNSRTFIRYLNADSGKGTYFDYIVGDQTILSSRPNSLVIITNEITTVILSHPISLWLFSTRELKLERTQDDKTDFQPKCSEVTSFDLPTYSQPQQKNNKQFILLPSQLK